MAGLTGDGGGVRARLAAAGAAPGIEDVRLALPPGGARPDPVRTQRHPVVDGSEVAVALVRSTQGRAVLEEGDDPPTRTRVHLGPASRTPSGAIRREVLVDGFRFEVDVEDERRAALRERATRARATGVHGGPLRIDAIIPGKVVAVSVDVGDAVTAGQQLLVVEAMKMQNELRSPRDGTVERVGVAVGDRIEVGDLLVVVR